MTAAPTTPRVPSLASPAAAVPALSGGASTDADRHAHSALFAAVLGFFVITLDAVVVDAALYVRSYRGTGGAWYQHAARHPVGSIRCGDHHAEVTFAPADQTQREAIDAAYRAKYARYGDTYLRPMLADRAVEATLRVVPQP